RLAYRATLASWRPTQPPRECTQPGSRPMMRELTPSHDMESGEGVAASRSAPPPAARNFGDNPLDGRLRRYAGRLRPHLRRLANESKAHADLLFSFPAASVAIATARPRGNRLRAFRLI